MITVLTGMPGNGKGVYGLDFWRSKAERENRVVYYSGINDCQIPGWIELDNPMDWYKCPPGSMILIDECQRIFRTRANGSTVPPHVSELETHRHNGLDLLLITQHPMLIDQNIRRLVGQHFHIVRKFGMEAAVVHEWNGCNTDPTKTRKDSIRHDYKYNKAVYTWYKSAELHTVKRNIPMRYYFLFAAPLLVIALGYFAYTKMQKVSNPTAAIVQNETSGDFPKPPQNAKPRELTYLESHAPEIQNLAFTAPIYKEVVKPVTAPYPAACIESKSQGCKCFSQQGTKLDTTLEMCQQIVKTGFFIEWEQTDPQIQALNRSNNGVSGQSPDVDRQPMQIDDAPLRASPSNV